MAESFLGEIRMWAFSWAPEGWALCDGTVMQIQQNVALGSLLGAIFGGDGRTTFGLPDLRGRTPVAIGRSSQDTSVLYNLGNKGGAEMLALNPATTPAHTHSVAGYAGASTAIPPTGAVMANIVSSTSGSTTDFSSFLPAANWTAGGQMAADSVSVTGSGAPHNNMQPFTVLNFTICTQGYFPPRN